MSTPNTSSNITTSETTSPLTPTPILVLPKCLIRPFSTSDAAALVQQANNPNVAKYLGSLFPSPYTLSDAHSWIALATDPSKPYYMNLALCALTPDGSYAYAGTIGFTRLGDVQYRTLEVGYWIGEEFWGKGIMSEAVTGLSRWAFENVEGLLRLEILVHGPNKGSARVCEKAGYTLEGVRRHAGEKGGVIFDMPMYSLLREECLGVGEEKKE